MSVARPARDIVRPIVFFVDVAGFTFEFLTLAQIETALAFFSQKVRPTSRWPYPVAGISHWEAQRWFERLPKGLLKESRRPKVVAALQATLAEFGRATQKER